MVGDLVNTLADLKEKEALAMVQERLDSGDDPMAILDDARTAMEVVGKRFEEHTYFIPDLVYSGEILKAISEIIKPLLVEEKEESEKLGKVLIGTVAGDIHDIGKNIVTFLLEVNGFEVKDVGVDVPVKKVVEAIEEFEPVQDVHHSHVWALTTGKNIVSMHVRIGDMADQRYERISFHIFTKQSCLNLKRQFCP